MEFIKAVTYGFMAQRGELGTPAARKSLALLKERTAATHLILAVVANQENAQATTIDWQSAATPSDEELGAIIDEARRLELKVILKPIVNVSDGTWRAHINFFDYDVPCEPKWSEWFASYQKFIVHYAKLATVKNCEMLVVGCELVNSDRRQAEWRATIAAVRQVYGGLLTYNCDKYQEEHVTWWDALDVISSSGYYPIDQWEAQLDRIEATVKKFNKPFFFCEVGCMSVAGSEKIPNDWHVAGPLSQERQAAWYTAMFKSGAGRPWLQGYGLWDWKATLYPLAEADQNRDYALYGKMAERVVKKSFSKKF